MVTIARASSPWGPFEPCPRNPILTHRDTPLSQPIQATGHADLVQDGGGTGGWCSWASARRAAFTGTTSAGRRSWRRCAGTRRAGRWSTKAESIPLDMHVHGLPASAVPAAPVRDDFAAPVGPAWNFVRNPGARDFSTTERPGWLDARARVLSSTVNGRLADLRGPPPAGPAMRGWPRASTSRPSRGRRRGWCLPVAAPALRAGRAPPGSCARGLRQPDRSAARSRP